MDTNYDAVLLDALRMPNFSTQKRSFAELRQETIPAGEYKRIRSGRADVRFALVILGWWD